MIYADTSALGRAYFQDEPDHETLRALLFDSGEQVLTSALTRVEIASASYRAARGGRIADGHRVVHRFDADCGPEGPIVRLTLRPGVLFPIVAQLLAEHALRALDAIHLAVALNDAMPLAGEETLRFATRDEEQAGAARTRGLTLA